MIYQLTIEDSRGRHRPFPFEGDSPEHAAHECAAAGDWEPWDRIEIVVETPWPAGHGGPSPVRFEIYTHPPYTARIIEET